MIDAEEAARRATEETSRTYRANGAGTGETDVQPFPFVVASTLAGQQPAERRWLVPDWIPDRVTTLLYGDGGTGKSLLAEQLMVSAATGTTWLGLHVDRRPAFGLFCEDEVAEVHRRLVDITSSAKIAIVSLDAFAWSSVVDEDAVLAVPNRDNPATMVPTPAWDRLKATIAAHHARLVVLDTAADIFGGDEIKRAQVRAFMQMLSRLAREIDGAVVVTAHPSVDGMRSGSGSSGSTGWSNGARSRLYLARQEDQEDVGDPDARVLTRKKANLAGMGDAIPMRWERGVFVATGSPTGIDRAAAACTADRVFLALLAWHSNAGINVSATLTARNYAPSIFAKHPNRENVTRAAFEGAMHRALTEGTARHEPYGAPSKRTTRLVPVGA